MQDYILAAHIGAQRALERNFNRSRHLEPVFPDGHARRHVRGANARGKRAQGAVGAGVGIRADHAVARRYKPFFRKQRMFNPGFPHIIKMGDAMLCRKSARLGAELSGFDVLAGGVMIQHNRDLFAVKHLREPRRFKCGNRDRRGDVIAEHEVKLRFDEVARFDCGQASMRSKNFFRHRHAHGFMPPLFPSGFALRQAGFAEACSQLRCRQGCSPR